MFMFQENEVNSCSCDGFEDLRYNIEKKDGSYMSKTVSLVLGSGGARGYVHIGIIRWLDENGYEIKAISGSSMGALIGGLYAAGKLGEYETWVKQIDKFDILKLLDPSMSAAGFIKGDKVINTLKEIVGECMIEDLEIEFTAVTTDLENEKEVWIDKGSLFDAIRASIAMPLFFTPFEDDRSQMLLDGGILNPVPIAPTFNDRTDLTIAVNLNGKPMEKPPKAITKQSRVTSEDSSIRKNIQRFIETLKEWTKDEEEIASEWSMYDIAMQSIDAMQGTIARQKLAAYPPDMLMEIPRNICGVLEFDRASEMIEYGYDYARTYFSAHATTTE